MQNIKLSPKKILDKNFDVTIEGYDSYQVDLFLDLISDDYNTFLDNITELEQKNLDLQKKINELKLVNNKLMIEWTADHKIDESVHKQQMNQKEIIERLKKVENTIVQKK